jgi:predicted lipid-binding transport protein (Tim44 family)
MKTVWKWVIGIVVVLVILALVVGGAFLLRSRMMTGVASVTRSIRPGTQLPGNRLPAPNNGTNGNGNTVRRFPGMMPYGGMGGRYMGGFGMMGLGRSLPFGGLFGGLVSLGLLALLVLAIIWLARSLRRPAVVVAAPVAAVSPVAPVVSTHPCPKCAEPVQENWKFCPNCGEKV